MGTFEHPTRTTHVEVEAVADCPFSMAIEYAADFLRAAEERGAESIIRVPWRLPFPLLRHQVVLTFGIHTDLANDGRPRDEMRVHWTSGTPLLPNFRGTIRFRIHAARTRVVIEGSYVPPLGYAGRLFDVTFGQWIARASVHDLADRIARDLTLREQAWNTGRDVPTEVALR